MIKILSHIHIHETELHFSFIRSPGPGGQNVNKVATAVLLRFNVLRSHSLPESMRARMVALFNARMTQHGDILIKASRFRTQERNKQDAVERLIDMLKRAAIPPKRRKKTKPSAASKQKRLETKKLRGKIKSLRRNKPASSD